MATKVSKVTVMEDTNVSTAEADTATVLAGILLVAEAWAHIPRKTWDGKVLTPESQEREVRRILAAMQYTEEEWQSVQTEPTRPARFPFRPRAAGSPRRPSPKTGT